MALKLNQSKLKRCIIKFAGESKTDVGRFAHEWKKCILNLQKTEGMKVTLRSLPFNDSTVILLEFSQH